ncbi:hypothetical protein OL548_08865 [Lysinibacillus sp. MHQ-1]|nr:hypothetical protein OL548_08865 [Lysinibacillus sp. MHQ-1]
MVTDDSGREVEIPVRAKRVITDWYLGQILALDIVPVGGVTANLDYAAFLKQHYKDGEITNIGTDGKVSLEKNSRAKAGFNYYMESRRCRQV